ncbi:MAG: 6,7-dimethyl-8-ribityllumazine synthase [Mesorhizobium sp.]|nr:MAG: 6,7-dimethyl-8-ribityllumazine synthase [Mesorhizobium sp.]
MAGISQHGKAFIRPKAKAHLLIIEARFHDDLPAVITFALDGRAEGGTGYDGFVALGTIIRGDTYHFDIVANESSRALMDLSVQDSVCIGNGILTTENDAQAWTRAKRSEGDKGGFAARAALTMIALKEQLGARS